MVGQRIQQDMLEEIFSAGRSTIHRLSFSNPLKVYRDAIRAHRSSDQLCIYHSIIEANRRSEYNPSLGSLPLLPCRNGEELVSAELHTFFPFDPYKLPCSGSYIQGVYREWMTVAIEGDEESDEEEDGEDVDEGDREFDHGSMLSVNTNEGALGSGGLQIPRAAQGSSSDADSLGESFGGMSVSLAQPRSVIMPS